MALEAWCCRRVDSGDPLEDVIREVLGEGTSPAAFLLPVVDMLLSYWPQSAGLAVPFLASPELLSLDRQRFAYDSGGFLKPDAAKEPPGTVKFATINTRKSRRICLDCLLGDYAVGIGSEFLPWLRSALVLAAERLGPPEVGAGGMGDFRFAAAHAVNRTDPSNWRKVSISQADGTSAERWQYVPPQREVEILGDGEAKSYARTNDLELRSTLARVLEERRETSSELINAGLLWAQSTPTPGPESDDEDEGVNDDWRARTKVIVAALAMRDGTDELRSANEIWARTILTDASQLPEDTMGSHRLLQYNTVAIAGVGLINMVRNTPSTKGLRLILELTGSRVLPMALAFEKERETVVQLDQRLPQSMLRIALVACIYPIREYGETDEEREKRTKSQKRRIGKAIDREIEWLLEGGEDPQWPSPPSESQAWQSRDRRFRPIILTGLSSSEAEVLSQDRFDSPSAAKWLHKVMPLITSDSIHWFRRYVEFYKTWTADSNGVGSASRIDSSSLPREWNIAYFEALARSLIDLRSAAIDDYALSYFFAFPEEACLDAMATFLDSVDLVYFNASALGEAEAVYIRSRCVQRLRESRTWGRVVEERSSRIEVKVGRALASLFMHNDIWSGGKCYINPIGADRVGSFMPMLADLAREGARSIYIANLFFDLVELRANSLDLSCLVEVAVEWLAAYPAETSFWVGLGFGRRICGWLDERIRIDSLALDTTDKMADLIRLLDAMISMGIAEALAIEELLQEV